SSWRWSVTKRRRRTGTAEIRGNFIQRLRYSFEVIQAIVDEKKIERKNGNRRQNISHCTGTGSPMCCACPTSTARSCRGHGHYCPEQPSCSASDGEVDRHERRRKQINPRRRQRAFHLRRHSARAIQNHSRPARLLF